MATRRIREGQSVTWGDADIPYMVVSRSPRRATWWIMRLDRPTSTCVEARESSLTVIGDPRSEDLAARSATSSKEAGQEAALASHAAKLWKSEFQAVVEKMPVARRFTSEDVTAVCGLPTGRVTYNGNNAVGAMMTALARKGIIRKTSIRVPSRRKHAHGAELIVWERI